MDWLERVGGIIMLVFYIVGWIVIALIILYLPKFSFTDQVFFLALSVIMLFCWIRIFPAMKEGVFKEIAREVKEGLRRLLSS
jgi:membrane protein implicated in regulation of membrane protease activity